MTNSITSRRFFQAARAFAGAGLLAAMTGCATGPVVKPLAEVETVTVEVAGPSFVGSVPVGSEVGLATGAGAVGGALYGAAAGFTCGPFFVICSPVAAVAGAIGGAVVAGTEEAVTTLPDGQAETFNAVLQEALKSYDPSDSLQVAAEDVVTAREKLVVPKDGQATLSLGLTRIDWVIGAGNTVRPRMTLSVTARSEDRVASRTYQRDGARLTVADWVADSGSPIKRELEALFTGVMVDVAADFDNEPEVEETEGSQ
jgi:hypothetical protein